MNILILTYQGDIAGSTQSIQFLCRGLADRGHKIVLGCRKESLLYRELKGSNVILEVMRFRSKVDLKNMKQIRDAVRKYKIDIINAQSSRDRYTSILANWLFRLGTHVIHTRRQRPNAAGGYPQRWFYQMGTKAMIAVSEGVKKGLVQTGIPAAHIRVIHNGTPTAKYQNIDQQKVSELKSRYGIQEDEVVIGCVSRRKRQEQILQAAALIKNPMLILMVGIEEDDALEKIRNSANFPHRIVYTGVVDSSLALHHFPLLSVNVLPSLIEGLSQSLLESMAMGVPVITTNAGGNPELVIDGNNGFLFEDRDVDGLAHKIQILISGDEIRQQFIQNGQKASLVDFNIENTIRQHEAFFKEIIKSR